MAADLGAWAGLSHHADTVRPAAKTATLADLRAPAPELPAANVLVEAPVTPGPTVDDRYIYHPVSKRDTLEGLAMR